jgi:hypothetical protein
MKQIASNLAHIALNSHVSVPVGLAAGLSVAAVIWPQYAEKLSSISAILNAYGIIAAANTTTAKQTNVP